MSSADESVQVTIEGQMITTLRSTAELLNQPPLDVEIDGRGVVSWCASNGPVLPTKNVASVSMPRASTV